MARIESRLARLEKEMNPADDLRPGRVVIFLQGRETEEEAYLRDYCEPLTEEAHGKYNISFIEIVGVAPPTSY